MEGGVDVHFEIERFKGSANNSNKMMSNIEDLVLNYYPERSL